MEGGRVGDEGRLEGKPSRMYDVNITTDFGSEGE